MSDKIDFLDIIITLWNKKYLILSVTVLTVLLAVIYAINLPNIYQSKAVLETNNLETSEKANSMGGISGISGIGGIAIPARNTTQTELGIAVVRSHSFFEQIYNKYDILPQLMAAESWNPKTNVLTYDPNIYDEKNKSWVRKVTSPKQPKPSSQEAHSVFLKQMKISMRKDDALVIISYDHISSQFAREFIEIIISEVNNIFLEKEVKEGEISVQYLNEQVAKTELSELRSGLSELIQKEISAIMIAKANPDFLFTIIDAPISPERKSSPQRSLIAFLGLVIGLLTSSFYILLRKTFK